MRSTPTPATVTPDGCGSTDPVERWRAGLRPVPAWLALLALLALTSLRPAHGQGLPAPVEAALARAKVPVEALSVLVLDAQGRNPPRLRHRADAQVNPASVMKLVTTYAALDLLGPAFSWQTTLFVDGPVRDGTLAGNLYIKGTGDPKLVVERLWLLLRRVQGQGIRSISGDIVLDNSAFDLAGVDPGGFDGEPLRPYNAAPDALLLNYKSVVMTFVADRDANLATIHSEPPLAGVSIPTRVALSGGDCADYRSSLRADFSDATRFRFNGTFPASCVEKTWSVAYPDPASFAARAVAGMWREIGGKLGGQVHSGQTPEGVDAHARLLFEVSSAPLAEVIRDINKYSNNVMAQQLFLTLSLPRAEPANGGATTSGPQGAARSASFDASRAVLQRWWQQRLGAGDAPVLDNGSGLSRDARVSAQGLAHLLQTAYQSPLMPELMASLPIVGVDGTMRRNRSSAAGNAHLKTGSLRDVSAMAGYVLGASGRRYVLVAITNHPNAGATRAAMDSLLEWTVNDE